MFSEFKMPFHWPELAEDVRTSLVPELVEITISSVQDNPPVSSVVANINHLIDGEIRGRIKLVKTKKKLYLPYQIWKDI